MAFKKAERKQAKLRLALAGPSNSGKTLTALLLAIYIARKVGKGRVAVIDSERGRSRMYAGYPLPDGSTLEFDVDDSLPNFSPESYVKALRQAEAEKYDVVVVDSTTHEWAGTGGILEKVDNAAAGGNKWAGWRVGTPAHQAFLDAMLSLRLHVIGTMRTKTEWVLETNDKGKQAPKAIGTAPVQREGIEYEWDFFGLIDRDHRLTVNKTTVLGIPDGKVFPMPGEDLADLFVQWLAKAPEEDQAPAAVPAKEEIPVSLPAAAVAASAAPAAQSTTPAPAAETSSAQAATAQATPAKATPAGAEVFAELIEKAGDLAELISVGNAIGQAHKLSQINDAERKALLPQWIAREKQLKTTKAV